MWHCFTPPVDFRILTIAERGLFSEMLRVAGTMGTIPYALATDPFDSVFRLCAGHAPEMDVMRAAFERLRAADFFHVDDREIHMSESPSCGCEFSER